MAKKQSLAKIGSRGSSASSCDSRLSLEDSHEFFEDRRFVDTDEEDCHVASDIHNETTEGNGHAKTTGMIKGDVDVQAKTTAAGNGDLQTKTQDTTKQDVQVKPAVTAKPDVPAKIKGRTKGNIQAEKHGEQQSSKKKIDAPPSTVKKKIIKKPTTMNEKDRFYDSPYRKK